jgi:AraC-like DNA-binding protein
MAECPDMDASGHVAEAFRKPDAARIVVRTLENASLGVTEIEVEDDGFGLTDPIPYTDAAMLAVQLKPIPFHEAISAGKPVPVYDVRPGDTLFYDMRLDPRANVPTSSHALHFVLPRSLLDGIADTIDSHHIDHLFPPTGAAVQDAQLARLARSVLPALRNPTEATALFSSHFMLTLGLYVCWRYGGMQAPQQPAGHLCRLQTRIAKEYLAANLDGGVELGELSRICGMPAHRFGVAFRETLGLAPHQWLTQHRLELAQSLLRQTRKAISDIAALCGFTDTDHFTLSFTQLTGLSPDGWRAQAQ